MLLAKLKSLFFALLQIKIQFLSNFLLLLLNREEQESEILYGIRFCMFKKEVLEV